jgi:hypothetical protein
MSRQLRAVVVLAMVWPALAGCFGGSSGCSDSRLPFVRFGDVTYQKKLAIEGELLYKPVDPSLLSNEYRRVAFRAAGGCLYEPQDGHSSLEVGTPLYRIQGYRPEFLVGSIEDGQAYLYEASYVRGAKYGVISSTSRAR